MSTQITQLRAEQVSEDERRRVADFIEQNEDSPVSILLRRLMTVTDHGVDVTMLSDDTEVSPNDAAKLLKMSRPHLLTFMERGLLPYHRVGTHRRIAMSDLLTFMRGREEGAAIMAEALGAPAKSVTAATPLSKDVLADLAEL